jgi:hypothetical protein
MEKFHPYRNAGHTRLNGELQWINPKHHHLQRFKGIIMKQSDLIGRVCAIAGIAIVISSCGGPIIIKCSDGNPAAIERDPSKLYAPYVKTTSFNMKAAIDVLDKVKATGLDVSITKNITELRDKLDNFSSRFEDLIKANFCDYNNHPCDNDIKKHHTNFMDELSRQNFALETLRVTLANQLAVQNALLAMGVHGGGGTGKVGNDTATANTNVAMGGGGGEAGKPGKDTTTVKNKVVLGGVGGGGSGTLYDAVAMTNPALDRAFADSELKAIWSKKDTADIKALLTEFNSKKVSSIIENYEINTKDLKTLFK